MRKIIWSKLRLSSGKKGRQEDMSSHKRNPSVAEEYNEAFRTKSYTELFNKVQNQLEKTCPDKGHSFSSSSPPTPVMPSHLSKYILDPPQETVSSILDRSGPHHFLFNYFDTSQEAGKVCEFVLANVHQVGLNYRTIKKITNLTEQYPDPTRWNHNQYDALYKNLASFATHNNPFSSIPGRFVQIHDTHVQLLQQLTVKYRKTKRRMKLTKYIKRGLSTFLMVGSSAAAVILLVLTAHSMVGMVAAPGLIVCLGFLMMKRKLKGQKRKYKRMGLEVQLDVAARGVYTLINDFDTMGQLVKGLYNEMEHKKFVAGTVVKRGRNGMLQEVVRDFKTHESVFLEQVEELKNHIYLCFLNINRARRLLVQEIV
ncbi:hypothetical protein CASFOL_015983 [Castilleja foliolosa]|uniref:Uncharacterized protein n=1 Tax=Castilleja foliolosa TaxID=1961234 RepID=A0ABD3DFA4_9LAMI